MEELWKNIKDYEGLYQISNLGRVKSLERVVKHSRYGERHINERILDGSLNKDDGYIRANLSKNGNRERPLVHCLVAEAFIPNPDNLPEVNHKDEDKTNNVVSNLEWCDPNYNNNYGSRNERIRKALLKPVQQYTKDGQRFIKEYPSAHEAASQNGITKDNIRKCCKGVRKSAGGFKWEYKKIGEE